MRKIIAISVNTNPKRYVCGILHRPHNGLATELTENKNLAKDFESTEKATTAISQFFNPFERIYKIETIQVTQPRAIGEIINEMK